MNFDFLSNPDYDLWAAFWMTIKLTFWSALGALVWGIVLAGMRVSPVPLMRGFGTVYVNIFRNTPLTVLITATSIVLADTMLIELSDRFDTNAFALAILGFIAYTATFVCEAIRSGINTVPPGQAEAARAIGLTFIQNLTLIILPQAIRSVIAPLASVLIALTKNTTVAASVGVLEASLLMSNILEFEADGRTAAFLTFAAGFVLLTLPMGLILGAVAKRMTVKR
ncbi:amino acid ABC transporter permease [Nakamurella antarctica]|uniref:Amino acid ABC transporter permease n=2 Tax=Nakamurella antarctica TaxID=1902245 RepID=A0A3G8ZK59_9ACTN|nr:amino acid ABC transporter permease [Nakamurella antarctica]AZI57643.1 amino acid ABC transporter permease [Nakamurella antarctica]